MIFTERSKAGQSAEGPTLYLRLKDGEAIKIIPRGEIYEFYSVFGTKGEVPAHTQGSRVRYKMNAVVYEDGIFKAKILEYGPSVYDQLAEINKICDVTKTKIRFSRKGSGKADTQYMLLPLVNEPISSVVMQQIEAVKLNILNPKKSDIPPPGPDDFPPDFGDEPMPDKEDLPF